MISIVRPFLSQGRRVAQPRAWRRRQSNQRDHRWWDHSAGSHRVRRDRRRAHSGRPL